MKHLFVPYLIFCLILPFAETTFAKSVQDLTDQELRQTQELLFDRIEQLKLVKLFEEGVKPSANRFQIEELIKQERVILADIRFHKPFFQTSEICINYLSSYSDLSTKILELSLKSVKKLSSKNALLLEGQFHISKLYVSVLSSWFESGSEGGRSLLTEVPKKCVEGGVRTHLEGIVKRQQEVIEDLSQLIFGLRPIKPVHLISRDLAEIGLSDVKREIFYDVGFVGAITASFVIPVTWPTLVGGLIRSGLISSRILAATRVASIAYGAYNGSKQAGAFSQKEMALDPQTQLLKDYRIFLENDPDATTYSQLLTEIERGEFQVRLAYLQQKRPEIEKRWRDIETAISSSEQLLKNVQLEIQSRQK